MKIWKIILCSLLSLGIQACQPTFILEDTYQQQEIKTGKR